MNIVDRVLHPYNSGTERFGFLLIWQVNINREAEFRRIFVKRGSLQRGTAIVGHAGNSLGGWGETMGRVKTKPT